MQGAKVALVIGLPAAIVLPVILGADLRIFGVMFFGGISAGIMPFEVYAAFVRFRASRDGPLH